jgi:hypothetical protein
MQFRNLISYGGTKEKLDLLREEWKAHLEEATTGRRIYKNDISQTLMVQNVLLISFDFKQNIALPCCTWQSNILYYKRKWNINVFNIVEESKDLHHIYLFDERWGS